MLLSIIIPMYNVELYVEQCLLSCLRQDIPTSDYEIIVVNDGSPDGSLAIAERMASAASNILIVSQPNGGLSVARNKGLSLAQGEYVWFVDSDDRIEENCLGRISLLLKKNVDILQLQYRKIYENGKPNIEIPFFSIEGVKNGRDVISLGGLPAPAPFSIYKRKFLIKNNLKFYEGIFHEDSEFKPRATFLAESIMSDTEVCYNYLQRNSGSITSSFKLRNATSMLVVMNNIVKFVQKQSVDMSIRVHFYRMVGMNMNSLLIGYRQLYVNDKKLIDGALKENKHLFICMMKTKKFKYILEGILFFVNLRVGFFFHKLFR